MGTHHLATEPDPERLRESTRAVIRDIRALERILDEDRIEAGVRRFGAEQEMVLVDESWRSAPVGPAVLEALDDERFTSELARFNLEVNLPPLELRGGLFAELERSLHELLGQAQAAARQHGATVLLTGILPTIVKSDLSLDNVTPKPRYHLLNDAIMRMARGARSGSGSMGSTRSLSSTTRSWRTVNEDEPVDLVAFVMDREQIRQILVEDDDHRLTGIVSYRSLLRLLAAGELPNMGRSVPVREIMEPDPISVTPETPTLEAIRLMREKGISCLPVLKHGKLVGLVGERDFMPIAGELLEEKLGGQNRPAP